MLTIKDMADLVGVPPVQLRLWLDAGKIKSAVSGKRQAMAGSDAVYLFSESDIEPVRQFARKFAPKSKQKGLFVDDGEQENFTVSEIALLWKVSTDTVQRMFENEPGILPIGRLRGKRRTIRIPRAVMERVKKRRSL